MRPFITSITILAYVILCPMPLNAQHSLDELEPNEYFDFWVGEWNLSWEDSEGTVVKGENKITKILDGKVLKENFRALEGQLSGYVGKSWSVFNKRTNEWKQTWVDNQGSYMDFIGKFEGDKRIFFRKARDQKGEVVYQRMVFYNIDEDSFTWDWEFSSDEGKNWNLQWRINYERAQ